jgi:hypothetical protein
LTSRKSPFVTFVGTTPNIGTTTAAFAAAYRMAESGKEPVGFLCMNLKSAKIHRFLRVERPSTSLDRLRPEMQSGTITGEMLKQASYQMPGLPQLHILFGNLMRDQAEYFTPMELEHLFNAAQETFRVTVADVGAYWDNAATVAAVRRADTRVLATTPALSHFQEDGRRWIGQLSPLFGVSPADYEVLLIHPPWRNGGFSMKDVRKELGLQSIGELRLSEELLSHLDNGRLEEWLQGNESGKRAMGATSEVLMKRYGMYRPANIKLQPWYRKLLTHRGGTGS